jgi:hypothetical protein
MGAYGAVTATVPAQNPTAAVHGSDDVRGCKLKTPHFRLPVHDAIFRSDLGVIVRSVAFANMEAWLHLVVKSLTGGR